MRRAAGPAALCASLLLAGCQTGPVALVRSDDPTVEVDLLSSNEPNRLGRAQLAAGNFGMAERHFRDAVEKDKGDVPGWMGLAAAYDNLGRFELADRAYGEAERLGGRTIEFINNRGYSYLLRGQGSRALAEFKRALALDPRNEVIQNNIKLLQLGQKPARAAPL